MKISPIRKYSAFSLIEVISVVAVISILIFMTVPAILKFRSGVESVKLNSDVAAVNSAIKAYRANGGKLNEMTDPQQILDKLKTRRSDADAVLYVGFSGSTIDNRLGVREADSDSDEPRAVWDSAKQHFEIRTEGAGVVFYLNETAQNDFGEEIREDSVLKYNPKPGWIWAYADTVAASPVPVAASPVSLTVSPVDTVPTDSQPATSNPDTLRPPSFNPLGGTYPDSEFPKPVAVGNPNHPCTWIMVSVGGTPFIEYTSALSIPPDSLITAYVTGDPADWYQSSITSANYGASPPMDPEMLDPPGIFFTDGKDFPNEQGTEVKHFEKKVDSISVALLNPNPLDSSVIYYQIEPAPSGTGPTTGFQLYSGKFLVTHAAYPDAFVVRAYAAALTLEYRDSLEVSKFATSVLGLYGGHIDLDTSDFIADIGSGDTSAHSHDITGKHDLTEIDFFAIPEEKQIEINEAIDPGQLFKLIVVNGSLSPDFRLTIKTDGIEGPGQTVLVEDYDDTEVNELPVYSFNGAANSSRLTALSIGMSRDALLYGDGVIPTNTGDVKANTPGKGGEWRNGALTIQAIAVSAEGDDEFALDPTLSNGETGAATSGLLWEASLFWHWDGDSYHEEGNEYVPRPPGNGNGRGNANGQNGTQGQGNGGQNNGNGNGNG